MSTVADPLDQLHTDEDHNPHPAPLGQALPAAASVQTLFARAHSLLPEIAQDAAAREQQRNLPYALLRRIAQAGLLTFRIPQTYGGPGGSIRDLTRFLIDLSAADSNIAQALRPNFGLIESLLFGPDEAARQLWFERLLAGHIVGNAGIERGVAHGTMAARILPDGEHYRVNGSKYYSTGALFADWISSLALDENGKETAFIVPRQRAGVELIDDFDSTGQRLTASGSTRFVNTWVASSELRSGHFPRDRRNPVTPLFQLVLASVQAGIARNALNDAVHYTKHHARPIRHSTAQRSVDDPYVRETVGQIAAQAYAAEAVVLRAAETLDAAWTEQLSETALTHASVDIAQAQYFAAAAALKAAEWAFDVGGASATDRRHNLDRHWRNARTVANHNPRQWKAAVVGAWLLAEEAPPTTGLF